MISIEERKIKLEKKLKKVLEGCGDICEHGGTCWHLSRDNKLICNKIEKSNIELMNKIINVEKRFIKLESSMEEVSKQQKYLWQTLEDLHLQEVKKK